MKKPIINTKSLDKISPKFSEKIDYIGKNLIDSDLKEGEFEEIRLEHCFLENITLNQTKIEEGKIVNCILDRCNFAGAMLNQLLLSQCEIKSNRMQGLQAPEVIIKDVYYRSCKLNSASRLAQERKRLICQSQCKEAKPSRETLNMES